MREVDGVRRKNAGGTQAERERRSPPSGSGEFAGDEVRIDDVRGRRVRYHAGRVCAVLVRDTNCSVERSGQRQEVSGVGCGNFRSGVVRNVPDSRFRVDVRLDGRIFAGAL